MKHVSPDCESDMWYESGDFGWQVPDELWERYEQAREALEAIGTEINACPVDPRPPPPAGTLERHLYDSYRNQLIASLQQGRTLFDAYRDKRSAAALSLPEEGDT